MEYVLLGALFLGILLFAIGWLMVVVAGFQRHPVTGLFAMIPVLNIITLPSLWHRVSAWTIIGFVGALLATGAWLGGAKNNLYQQAQVLGANIAVVAPVTNTSQPAPAATPATAAKPAAPAPTVTTTPLALPSATASQTATPPVAAAATAAPSAPVQAAPVPAAPAPTVAAAPAPAPAPALPPTEDLPHSALYQITFEDLPVAKLTTSDSKYVRLVQKDGRRREGKIHIGAAGEISLEEREESGLVTHPIKVSDIRTVSIMTNKKDSD
ncbi:MAG: hypothetical protein PHE17_11015 [Thiothrix sp.]|uniref:hypothetical protein n=1 Tax=Thiothrix sp. TaxID=1032 RepID=UPI00261D0B9A|nr:hypothetical protein [Thiothrix sp.]MDD5393537.1 hypothetical protein [Thiothrix sp.]